MTDALTPEQIEQFVRDGFVRIDEAFPVAYAEAARSILWQDINADPTDPATWTRPVVWLGMYSQDPFVQAANTPVLHRAFDQLIGPGRWIPCRSMGTFPVCLPDGPSFTSLCDSVPLRSGW